MKEQDKEVWYLHKLKKHFGGDMEVDEILDKYAGLQCVKVCNMLTAGELELEWVDEFTDGLKIQYKNFPANLSEFADEFRWAQDENVAEVIGVDGKIARFAKSDGYRKYVGRINEKYETIKTMYEIENDELIKENEFYKLNLFEFESHPSEENAYSLYRDNEGQLQLGYLHLYKPKNKSSNGIELFFKLVEDFKEKVAVGFSKVISVTTDFKKVNEVEWRLYQSFRLQNNEVVIKFEVVPAVNHLSKSIIKFSEYWPLLLEEKIGSEKYRALKIAHPLLNFQIFQEEIGPYLFDEKNANEIKRKVYEQLPTFESMYKILLAYDKSRVIEGKMERFEKQLSELILVLEKIELYDSKRGFRINKGRIDHKMLTLSSILLENIHKNSSQIWSEQEALINEMYTEAKKILEPERHDDLNVLFFKLHCRTADENELLSEYIVHELIYTKELKTKKIVSN